MFFNKKVFIKIVCGFIIANPLIGCLEEDSTLPSDVSSSMATISGAISTTSGAQKVGAMSAVRPFAVTDYQVYCVTFTQIPYAASSLLGADGSFSLQMPLSSPFGCFVNTVATNQPVATMVIEGASSGFGGDTTSSLNLASNVDFGALTLDLDAGKVAIPKARVAASTGTVSSSLSPTSLHNQSYVMSCVSTGNTVIDTACSNFLADNNNQTVFMRVMTASKGTDTVYGLGVWRSQSDFSGCGSIDFTSTDQSNIESGDSITFTSVSAGSAFTNNQTTCPTRDGNAPTSMDDPEFYYAAGPLVPTGSGYTLRTEGQFPSGANCTAHDQVVVTFESPDGINLVGNFQMGVHYEESVDGACSGQTDEHNTFVVNFTKQ